jgi:hypothetical protein
VIPIVAGVQYAIVVNYEGAPPPGPGQFQGGWAGASGNQYPGGAAYASFLDGISWVVEEAGLLGADLHFQTYVNPALFAGTPGTTNCHGESVSALAQEFGGLRAAAAALGFPSVRALQDAIRTFCKE